MKTVTRLAGSATNSPICLIGVVTLIVLLFQVVVTAVASVTTSNSAIVPAHPAAWYPDPHPFLTDHRLRQAIAYCTDKLGLIAAVYPLLTADERQALVMHSMIPRSHWAYAGDANLTIYPYDPTAGIALLEAAGWTLQPGATYRTNAAGEELAIKLTTTTAALRMTLAETWEEQMRDCGIRVVRLHAPASWWFGDTTGLTRRDFELGGFAWVAERDPGGRDLWACDRIPAPENGWTGYNYMGWCNPVAHSAVLSATTTLDQDARQIAYRQLQQAYTADVPALPLFARMRAFATNADLTGFQPEQGEPLYTYNAGVWAISGKDSIVHGTSLEPASLFDLAEEGFIVDLVLNLLGAGASYTTLGYDAQSVWLVALPTIENGRALNNTVTVNQGELVVDADNNVVELQPGVVVYNAAGQRVTYNGGPIQMKQLVVNYEYRSDLKWPDGQSIQSEDIELGYAIDCHPDSGAVSYETCNRTLSFNVNGLIATQTMLPGDQSPLYSTRDFHVYPAHRQLQDGRRLDQVPASEWASLEEILHNPWGFGPYQIANWVAGEKIELTAHPYWFGGTPATPNYVLRFISPEVATELLINRLIDIIGDEVLAGLSQELVDAEIAGTIEVTVLPGSTWEHIDMNFSAQPPPNTALNDVRLRKAIAYCTDRRALAHAAYPTLSDPEIDALMMDSFFPSYHWGYVQPATQYPYNPDVGRALLEQAGWSSQPDAEYRSNAAGDELALKFITTTSSMRYALADVWEDQMRDCGIRIVRLHAPASWWFGETTGLARRDFDIGEFAWVFNNSPDDVIGNIYAFDRIPSAANGWEGLNYNGWYDPSASINAHLGDNLSLSLSQRRDYYAIVQERFAMEVPSIPLFERYDAPGTWEHIDFNMTTLPQIYLPITRK